MIFFSGATATKPLRSFLQLCSGGCGQSCVRRQEGGGNLSTATSRTAWANGKAGRINFEKLLVVVDLARFFTHALTDFRGLRGEKGGREILRSWFLSRLTSPGLSAQRTVQRLNCECTEYAKYLRNYDSEGGEVSFVYLSTYPFLSWI